MSKPTEADIRAEVEKLRTLGKDDLRVWWSTLFGKTPPAALTKDLLRRMIAWRIQEKFYGGHDKATLKLLDGLARGKVAKPATEPQLRPGTVLMREHGGMRHTVTGPIPAFRPSPAPSPGRRGTDAASSACG